MSQEGEKLPRLIIVDHEWEDGDGEGDVLNAKDEEPPAGIVDPELRKMWHDFRAINKARPDRDLELPRNLSDDDVAIMLNAIARGQDSAGAQLALAHSSHQQHDATSAETMVKNEVEKSWRSRLREPKILAHSSQLMKVREPKKRGRPPKAVSVPLQASQRESLGEIASKMKEGVAITPREIPKGKQKRAKSEVLPFVERQTNERLSTPRERTTSYKVKLNPVWMPLNISLLDPPTSETDEIMQMTPALGPDQDMHEEQAIPANGRLMRSDHKPTAELNFAQPSPYTTQLNGQNSEMMPRLVCYYGGVPHPFCGPLPSFMTPSPMHLQAYHNQETRFSNYAYNFPQPQTSNSTVNGWFENDWNTQFMPPMAAPTPFYQPMQLMQPHTSVHQEPLPGENGGKLNRD